MKKRIDSVNFIFVFLTILLYVIPVNAQKISAYTVNRFSYIDTTDKEFVRVNEFCTFLDTIAIKSFYKKSNDFSFYYFDLWDSTNVIVNGITYNKQAGYEPYVQNYLIGLDSIFVLNNLNVLILLGKPFFTNGFYSSNISVLFIDKVYHICYEIETKYKSYYKLLSKLKNLNDKDLKTIKLIQKMGR